MPEISFIVPCYNQASYVGQALDSVIAQGSCDWECIVVDDGSTDDSRKVLSDYKSRDHRIKVLLQDNQGVSAARNRGIDMAGGEFLLFLDADDSLKPELCTTLLPILRENRDVTVAFGCSQDMDGSGDLLGTNSKVPKDLKDYLLPLLMTNLFQLNCAVVRSEKLRLGKIRFREDLRPEDWAFWIELALDGAKFMPVDRIVCNYRKHGQTRSTQIQRRTEAAEKMLESMFSNALKKYEIPINLSDLSRSAMYARFYVDAYRLADHEGMKYCMEKIKENFTPRLIGLSPYHIETLGRYLDLTEKTGSLPILYPLVWIRCCKRLIVAS